MKPNEFRNQRVGKAIRTQNGYLAPSRQKLSGRLRWFLRYPIDKLILRVFSKRQLDRPTIEYSVRMKFYKPRKGSEPCLKHLLLNNTYLKRSGGNSLGPRPESRQFLFHPVGVLYHLIAPPVRGK